MRVAVKPIFRSGEAVASLCARAAYQRRVTTASYLRTIGVRGVTSPATIERIEQVLRYPDEGVAEWALISHAGSSGILTFRDQKIHAGSGVAKQSRVCLACLAEDRANSSLERDCNLRPYVRSIWLLAHLTICPVHSQPLIDHCACGEAVDCSQAPMDRCQSGHRLSAPETPDFSDLELRANDVVVAKLLGYSKVFPSHLQPLNWFEAGHLMCALGTFVRGRHAKIGQHGYLGVDEMRVRLGAGLQVVEGLPDSFEHLIEFLASSEERGMDPYQPGSTTIYGGKLEDWLRTTSMQGMEVFKEIVAARKKRNSAASADLDPGLRSGLKYSKKYFEVPNVSFHKRIKRIPDETSEERSIRMRALWERRLTPTEVERMVSQGLKVNTNTRRIEALELCRQNDLVVTKYGAGSILGTCHRKIGALMKDGALPLVWPADGTQELCFRSEVLDLKRKISLGQASKVRRFSRRQPQIDGYSAQQFSEKYRIHKRYLSNLISVGAVRVVRLGVSLRISAQDADAFNEVYVSTSLLAAELSLNTKAIAVRTRNCGIVHAYTGIYLRKDLHPYLEDIRNPEGSIAVDRVKISARSMSDTSQDAVSEASSVTVLGTSGSVNGGLYG